MCQHRSRGLLALCNYHIIIPKTAWDLFSRNVSARRQMRLWLCTHKYMMYNIYTRQVCTGGIGTYRILVCVCVCMTCVKSEDDLLGTRRCSRVIMHNIRVGYRIYDGDDTLQEKHWRFSHKSPRNRSRRQGRGGVSQREVGTRAGG